MRILQIAAMVIACALSAACTPTQSNQAPAPQREKTRCETIIDIVRHPWATHEEKAMAFELARNEGCLGAAPAQRIDLTVR